MNFNELAKSRYSCRSMDATHKVEEEKIKLILESARLAPTANNLQRQRIIVVCSDDGIAKIRKCTPCHYNAPVVLILSFEKEMQGMDVPEEIAHTIGLLDMGIVASHIALQAQELGLGNVIAGNFDEGELKRNFSIPESQIPVLIIPIGYSDEKGTPSELHDKSKTINEFVKWE